ncbi:hypothetical protein BBJ28_00019950 [Nothophytophthora sp. Chile5]|nr:hypothetical protein BBJ28_00019950 [Nothophytophthora sp. Chile5]
MAAGTATGAKLGSEKLRGAYQAWLKDLYDDKPERLLRKLDPKKKTRSTTLTRRSRRQQHAQQHTAASALKDVAARKLPALAAPRTAHEEQQAQQESQRRRHQTLVDEANYISTTYPHQPAWRPGLAFYQQLVDRALQKAPSATHGADASPSSVFTYQLADFSVRLSPILVRVRVRKRHRRESRFGVALFFCQEAEQEASRRGATAVDTDTGNPLVLHIHVYSSASSWREHREALMQIVSSSSGHVRAVWKRSEDFECRRNGLRLLHSRQDVESALDELWADSSPPGEADYEPIDELCAIQKFIPCKGAADNSSSFGSSTPVGESRGCKAWIVRCSSRKKDKSSSTVWIISGGSDRANAESTAGFATNSSSAACQVVKCSVGQAWSEPRLVSAMCALMLEKTLRVTFNELVVDLLQDAAGTWWLLQVKAFDLVRIRPSSASLLSGSSASASGELSRTLSAPSRFEAGLLPTSHWKKWRCAGRFCTAAAEQQDDGEGDEDDDCDDKEPRGYLTKKVLRSCEFYDDFVRQQDVSLAGGFAEFPAALAFHLQHRLPKRDRSQLYEPQPLCQACVRRYHSLRQQWTQAVTTPRTTAASLVTTHNSRHSKILRSKQQQHAKSAEHLPPLPRKLPSLYSEVAASASLSSLSSAPVFLASKGVDQRAYAEKSRGNTDREKPSYLDELAAMEEMFAEHEPRSTLSSNRNAVPSQEHQADVASTIPASSLLSSSSERLEDLFPKWNGASRIEEMWQKLMLKPLPEQLTESSDIDSKKQSYNSFSLQTELAKLEDTSNVSNEEDNQQISHDDALIEVVQRGESNQPPLPIRLKLVAPHMVRIQHCRQVFEDELYREQIVNDAMDAFLLGKSDVFLLVTPDEHAQARSTNRKLHAVEAEQQDELADMVLRSLYLDVKHAVAAAADQSAAKLSLSSWPMRPEICREASGCMTVKLGLT